ncbi:MAG: hypothetical protein ACOX5G_13140 [Kiritimatiellia bacterium]|jgi:hypothetical protein
MRNRFLSTVFSGVFTAMALLAPAPAAADTTIVDDTAMFSWTLASGTTIVDGAWVKVRTNDDSESLVDSGTLIQAGRTLELKNGARVSTVGLRHNTGSAIAINSGSTLAYSRPFLDADLSGAKKFGTVSIDGGSVAGFDLHALHPSGSSVLLPWASWFACVDSIAVGNNGATFLTPSKLASLGPRLVAADGATNASVTVDGAAALGMRSTALPVAVASGGVRFGVRDTMASTRNLAGTVAFAPGTTLHLSGDHSAAKMDVSSAQTILLHSAGLESERGNWVRNGWATIRPDGYLQLGDSNEAWNDKLSNGSVFRREKFPVDTSFTVTFSAIEMNNRGGSWYDQAGGFAIVFHNSSAGLAAVSTATGPAGASLGGYSGTVQQNAAAVIFTANDIPNPAVRKVFLGTGSTVTELGGFNAWDTITKRNFNAPVRFTFDYDAVNKRGSVAIVDSQDAGAAVQSFEFDLDLAALVGAGEAYFGFTGSSYGGWKEGVHVIGQVDYKLAESAPRVSKVGGAMDLSAGATRNFRTNGSELNHGFLMDTLVYGNGTTLDIAKLNEKDDASSYVGFENHSGSGTLVKSGAGNIGFAGSAAQNVALNVAEGGVVLHDGKAGADPTGWDWVYSDGRQGSDYRTVGDHGGVVVGCGTYNAGFCATTKDKFDVSGDWRFSVDVYPTGLNADDSVATDAIGYAFGLAFHDDPRGVGYTPSTGHTAGLCNSLKYGAGWVACPCIWCGENRRFGALFFNPSNPEHACTYPNYSGGTTPFTPTAIVNGDVVHVTMEYSSATKVMTYWVAHNDEEGQTVTFADDLSARIRSGLAHLTLSIGTKDAKGMRCEFANMKFERLDGKSEAVSVDSLASLASSVAELPVRCEASVAGSSFAIETVTLPENGGLAVAAPYAAATLQVGTLATTADGRTSLALDENATVSVQTFSGAKTVTVESGTLKLTSVAALDRDAELLLLDDAKLDLDFVGTMPLRRVKRNGAFVGAVLNAATCDWVEGTGSLANGFGTTVILR